MGGAPGASSASRARRQAVARGARAGPHPHQLRRHLRRCGALRVVWGQAGFNKVHHSLRRQRGGFGGGVGGWVGGWVWVWGVGGGGGGGGGLALF